MADLTKIKTFIEKEPTNAGNDQMSNLLEIKNTTLPDLQGKIDTAIADINKSIEDGAAAYSEHHREKLNKVDGGKPTRRRRAPRRGKKLGGKSRRCKK